jgi:general secretion pathway protein B
MSYILDALRKSEQQRLRGEAPLLITTQITSTVEKRPAYLLYGLFAVILTCAGILIGWLRPWHQDDTVVVKDAITVSQLEAKPSQLAPNSQPLPLEPEKAKKPELLLPAPKLKPTMKLVPGVASIEKDAPESFEAAALQHKAQVNADQPKAPELKIEEASIPPTFEATGNDATETAQEHKIVAIAELPLAIQQEIPKMSISGYAYSNTPKERSVGINDRLLQEGEYLAPGLKLEQITEDGLVFSYKKYLFRHSL